MIKPEVNIKKSGIVARAQSILRRAFTKLSTMKARYRVRSSTKSRSPRLVSIRAKVGHALSSRLSLKEQTFFIKRLSLLINAGLPVIECLYILREQTRSRGHRAMLDQVIQDTSNGQALSRSFSKFPHIFSDFAVHIVRVGESSGTLSQNLEYLADELKKKQLLRSKVIGAFIYPAVVTAATLGITVFLMVYLFPKIMPIFNSLHAELPFTTRTVIFLSTFLQDWGLLLFIVLTLCVVLFSIALRMSSQFSLICNRFMLRIPAFGPMIRYYNVANGSRTLGLLLKSGIKLSEALPIAAETTPNPVYKREYRRLSEVVNRGERLSSYLQHRQYLFPDVFGHMVSVGERSGTLSDTLVYLSAMYESEVDDFTKNISTLLEPALMIFMGVLVGFIAVSIIAPIYGITQNLHA